MLKATCRLAVLTAMLFFLCLPLAAYAMEIPTPDILNAAEQGLKPYIAAIPSNSLPHFGFEEKSQADTAVLGQAFHVYTAPPSAILDDKANDLSAAAVPTAMWDFLILSGGKSAALLTVDKMGSKYEAVSIGGSGTAGQLSVLTEAYPVSEGYEYRVIRVFQASAEFVEVSQNGRSIGIVPLSSARVAMGLSSEFAPGEIFTPEAAAKMIKPAVRANIGGDAVKAPPDSSSKTGIAHSATTSFPPAIGAVVDVPEIFQQEGHWCWAASSQCVLQFYGIYESQCKIANFARIHHGWGDCDCCVAPSNPICNQGNYDFGWRTGDGDIVDILKYYGNIDCDKRNSALSWNDAESQINSGRPFTIFWTWTTGGGHFMVGFGCVVENNIGMLQYMDPRSGYGYTISNITWVQESSDHQWSSTMLMKNTPLLPDLTPFKPSGWSAPLVVTKTKGSRTDSSTLGNVDYLYIDWAVLNLGFPIPNQPFYTNLTLDGKQVKFWTTNPPLGPGMWTETTDFALGRLTTGIHSLTLTANFNNSISETNINNNTYTKKITIIDNDKPNLTFFQPAGWSGDVVVSTSAESYADVAPIYSNELLYVHFGVTNNGNEPITNSFNTNLYVDGNLKENWSAPPLPFAVNAKWAPCCYIGSLPAGTHTIMVVLDPYNTIDELNKSDNTFTKTILVHVPWKPAQ
jgi:hypothetical protein